MAPGQVTGFVGPNGAGKSTTMRVILGLDAPDAGTALVSGGPTPALQDPLTQVGALLDAARAAAEPQPGATTCCGSPTPRGWAPAGSTR